MKKIKNPFCSLILLSMMSLLLVLITACGDTPPTTLQNSHSTTPGSRTSTTPTSTEQAKEPETTSTETNATPEPVQSVETGSDDSTISLFAVAAVSSQDMWAVGQLTTSSNQQQTLTEHWNGTTWTRVASPNTSGNFNKLNAVAAITTNNVWAVGTSGQNQPLIEHWNGSTWSIVSSPALGSSGGSFRGISALSSTDVWAVGEDYNTSHTLIEHWNGSAWSVMTTPDVGTNGSSLSSVTAIAPNNVWAVGAVFALSVTHPLIEHWNGTAWSIVTAPTIASTLSFSNLNGLYAVSPNDIWAVGESNGGTDASQHNTLTLHWDGTKWSVVTSFNTASYAILSSVTATSSTDVWAAGYYYNDSQKEPLVLHWAGSTWQPVTIDGSPDNSELIGVTALSSSNVWGVGDSMSDSNTHQEFKANWNGSSWQDNQ